MCVNICEKPNFIFKRCMNYNEGKQVYHVKLNDNDIVLKSERRSFYNFPTLGYDLPNGSHIFPSLQEFSRIVRESLWLNARFNFSHISDTTALNSIWSMQFQQFVGSSESLHAAMLSLWSLLQQDEYVMLVRLLHNTHFPHVLGTCGHFYAIDYIPSDAILSPRLVTGGDDWSLRAHVARQFLELAASLDRDFGERVHICDVKADNFGLGADLGVYVIDADSVLVDSRLRAEFAFTTSNENCSSHEACSFFDCLTLCNFETGWCQPQRINSNLQVICRDIFTSRLSNARRGLLRSPPTAIANRLAVILKECVNLISASNEQETYIYSQLDSLLNAKGAQQH
ncbi:PREDICTED: protein FAM69C-like isoform X2 [Priapulus caudatus]|nr:PREDICTED: protein FAM69C-like isoform X2 [Priapulus caudatus]